MQKSDKKRKGVLSFALTGAKTGTRVFGFKKEEKPGLQKLKITGALKKGYSLLGSRRTSTLVIGGAYSYCRHPQTMGFILATPAFALMFDFVPFLIIAILFTPLQLALLGYEEVELLRRFGDTYGTYREAVPFIIPRGRRILPKA